MDTTNKENLYEARRKIYEASKLLEKDMPELITPMALIHKTITAEIIKDDK